MTAFSCSSSDSEGRKDGLAASQEVASPSSECREGVDMDFFIASAPGSRGGRAGHGVSGTYGPGT